MPCAPRSLDNAVWHALTTHHQAFAEVAGAARRYHPDVSVFAAVDDTADDGWDDLATLVGPSGPGALFRAGSRSSCRRAGPASVAARATRWCSASSRR